MQLPELVLIAEHLSHQLWSCRELSICPLGWFGYFVGLVLTSWKIKHLYYQFKNYDNLLVWNEFCSEKAEHWAAYLCIRFFYWLLFPENFFTISRHNTKFYFPREGRSQWSEKIWLEANLSESMTSHLETNSSNIETCSSSSQSFPLG